MDSVIIRFATPLKDVPVCFSVTVCSLSELLGSQSDLRNSRNIFIGHTLSYLHILSISVTLVFIHRVVQPTGRMGYNNDLLTYLLTISAGLMHFRSGLVVSASDCGVKGPRFESHRGQLCLS